METKSLRDLVETIADERAPMSADVAPGEREHAAKNGDSIFSQLLLRLLAGTGIKLGDERGDGGSLEILIENSQDPILIMSQAGILVGANPAFCQAYGWSRSELLGQSLLGFVPEADWPSVSERILGYGGAEGAKREATGYFDFRAKSKGGPIIEAECLLSQIWSGEERRVVAVLRDLPRERALLEELRESKDHYLALSETITEAIFRLDTDFSIIFANSGVKNTFGFDREELEGKRFSVLFPAEVFEKHRADFSKYFVVDDQDRAALGLKRTIEILGVTKNRGVTPMEMSFGNSRDFSGRTLTCIVRDISQRKTMERRLRHLAYHDKLTGLGNRDLFNEDMKLFLKEPGLERGKKASLLFLDLDGFKHVNDTIGHSAGDEILVETARRIRVCLRDGDSAYRFGGDEFVVFIPELAGAAQAVAVAERILGSIRESFEVTTDSQKRTRVEIGVSIGVAMMPDHGKDAAAATKSADIAMYCSKEGGKNRITVYDEELNTKSNQSWRLEQDIRAGLVNGEFDLAYQPIVTPGGRLLGAEALLRWNQGGRGPVSPSSYIRIAEESGAIIPLGTWVLRRACFDLQKLAAAGFGRIYFSVNISGRQLDQPDFVGTLCDAIDQSGIDSGRLNLEITETTLMHSADDAVTKFQEIKRRYPGIMISIDDFGTGYSSLAYLSRLPVDLLKIDISFVRALEDEQNRKVVNSILNLAESLGIAVVAEGIETRAQRDYFRERHCYGMQGFLFMRAQSLDALERRLGEARDSARRRREAAIA